jgi:serine/threonine-protein kinase
VTTATDPLLNRLFDRRYLIQRKLGSGGMAAVYLAEDQELGRRVALKLLDDRHASDEQFVERFRREAQNAAGLNHPNIVSIFDRGHAEETYYIAMEFLDGRTLKELVLRNGPTPIPIAIDYARQILQALAFAHRHGIVHRDIKPHNIVVGRDGRLKVTDFGIARSGASQMTEVGSIVGTAQYLSPEQARGAQVDPRSDLYSLGIVMYEMLTGKVPFTGEAPLEIAMKHLQKTAEPPSKLRPEVPKSLDAVVMRALAKDPDERFDSAEEMDADLARVGRGLAVSRRTEEAATQIMRADDATAATMVSRPRTVTPPPAPPVYRPPGAYYEERPRRSPWPWIWLLLALVIIGGTGYFAYDRIQDQLDKNRPVTVKDVGRLKLALARQQLEADGFQVRVIKTPNRTVEVDSVIRQDPAGGEPRPKGSTVTLYVSTGIPKSTVPEVVGLSQTDAITALVHSGLSAKAVLLYSSEPSGTVTGQNPGPGAVVPSGSTVRINVSQGEQLTGVPSVVGEPYLNAASALQGAGFSVSRIDADSDEPKGTVIAQDPVAGSNVKQHSRVTVTVSKGPTTADVPSVTGDALADAQQLLEDAGFKWTVVPSDVTDPSQDGLVLAQDPQGGKLEKGTTVTLTVGKLVSPTVETPQDADGDGFPDSTDTTTATDTTTTGATSQTPP